MTWLESVSAAILTIFYAAIIALSGLGMMFALEPRLQRVYTVAFIISLSMALSVIYRGLS